MKISTLDRKKFRVRNKLKKVSSKDRFRVSVSRSTRNISAQIIDDVNKITLVSNIFFSFIFFLFKKQNTL